MPTIPCPDCGQPVSPIAAICPHCGRPLKPISAGPGGGDSVQSRATTKLSQLSFSPTKLALATERVRNLTLKDLDDLVVYVKGQPVDNPAVTVLQATDLKSLDDLFADQRARALQIIASAGPGGPVNAGDAPSGSCCTPCCCTAAVEIDPFMD